MREIVYNVLHIVQEAIDASYLFLVQQLHVPSYIIKLLITFVVVLLVCAWVWQLSKHLSKRDLFELDLSRYESTGSNTMRKISALFLYILEYLILFPIYTIFWGGVFVLLLVLMAVPESYPNVIFFAAVILSAIRAIAYFNEEYANDLAKQLPILMLVTTVLNPSVLSKVNTSTLSINLPYLIQTDTLLMSIGFVVGMEWIMRLSSGLRKRPASSSK